MDQYLALIFVEQSFADLVIYVPLCVGLQILVEMFAVQASAVRLLNVQPGHLTVHALLVLPLDQTFSVPVLDSQALPGQAGDIQPGDQHDQATVWTGGWRLAVPHWYASGRMWH